MVVVVVVVVVAIKAGVGVDGWNANPGRLDRERLKAATQETNVAVELIRRLLGGLILVMVLGRVLEGVAEIQAKVCVQQRTKCCGLWR